MSHTLGPWTVVHYEWKDKGGGDFVGRIQGPNGEKVYGGASSFHAINNLANARLIAAAPDLLEACEKFLKAYEEASSELHFGQALDSAFADVLEPMYAAIAKARVERND